MWIDILYAVIDSGSSSGVVDFPLGGSWPLKTLPLPLNGFKESVNRWLLPGANFPVRGGTILVIEFIWT